MQIHHLGIGDRSVILRDLSCREDGKEFMLTEPYHNGSIRVLLNRGRSRTGAFILVSIPRSAAAKYAVPAHRRIRQRLAAAISPHKVAVSLIVLDVYSYNEVRCDGSKTVF